MQLKNHELKVLDLYSYGVGVNVDVIKAQAILTYNIWPKGHLTTAPICGPTSNYCHNVGRTQLSRTFVLCSISLHWNGRAQTCFITTMPLCTQVLKGRAGEVGVEVGCIEP